jgi:hypothetical protein
LIPNLETSCPDALDDDPFCADNWKLLSAPLLSTAVIVEAVAFDKFKLPDVYELVLGV